MGIPPQAARIAGAWPQQQARPVQSGRHIRRDRSHRISVARILHPLHRPIPAVRIEGQGPAAAKPAQHA